MSILTDRPALLRQRARAARHGTVDFLHQAAIVDVQDRVAMVNKSFTDGLIVSGHPDIWSDAFPEFSITADEDVLGLGDARFDLIVHAMALHWSNDPVGQLIQCRRALRPDGLLLAIFPGGQTLHELRACLADAEVAATGGLSPRVAPMGEVRDLGGLLQRAGLALPVADTISLRAIYPNALRLMHDLRAMGEGNALDARLRHATRRSVLTDAAAHYAQSFPAPEGGVEATFELITLTGWAPDATQPKALRPGSAQQRLADALGVPEERLQD